MEIYETLGALFNKATEVIATERDEAEQRRLRQPLGMAMAQLWTDLQLPLFPSSRTYIQMESSKTVEIAGRKAVGHEGLQRVDTRRWSALFDESKKETYS